MTQSPFGNDPAKIAGYRAFWHRHDVKRPLVGFSFDSWLPLEQFSACSGWESSRYLTPDMIEPEAFLDDQEDMLRVGETIDDDIIRGSCAAQMSVPWLPAMLGCEMRILPGNVLGEAQELSWDEALDVRLQQDDPWFRKYMDFVAALVQRSAGRFPVSHGPELGPTDLHASLRGQNQSIIDLIDEPEKSAELLRRLGDIWRQLTEEHWRRVPRCFDGYFDAQYSLWSPGPIIRLQEDASAVYSPKLYRRFVQPVDREVAGQFANAFIHLHSTSMFLLEEFLEVAEIGCFEVNHDLSGPSLRQMVPYFQMIQEAGRPLLVRGAFSQDEIRLLMDSLSARGLYLLIMVQDMAEAASLRPLLGM